MTVFSRKTKDMEDLISFYSSNGRVMLVSVISGDWADICVEDNNDVLHLI